mmetsp:Transcript_6286/g.16066  ORF Transcript_6286/g.16066 Transcript_6286/m.16066 type:complete len:311 (-) Transcript_6286:238-1170(-)
MRADDGPRGDPPHQVPVERQNDVARHLPRRHMLGKLLDLENLLVHVVALVGEDDEGVDPALLVHVPPLVGHGALAYARDGAAPEAGAHVEAADRLACLALDRDRRCLDARLLRGDHDALDVDEGGIVQGVEVAHALGDDATGDNDLNVWNDLPFLAAPDQHGRVNVLSRLLEGGHEVAGPVLDLIVQLGVVLHDVLQQHLELVVALVGVLAQLVAVRKLFAHLEVPDELPELFLCHLRGGTLVLREPLLAPVHVALIVPRHGALPCQAVVPKRKVVNHDTGGCFFPAIPTEELNKRFWGSRRLSSGHCRH